MTGPRPIAFGLLLCAAMGCGTTRAATILDLQALASARPADPDADVAAFFLTGRPCGLADVPAGSVAVRLPAGIQVAGLDARMGSPWTGGAAVVAGDASAPGTPTVVVLSADPLVTTTRLPLVVSGPGWDASFVVRAAAGGGLEAQRLAGGAPVGAPQPIGTSAFIVRRSGPGDEIATYIVVELLDDGVAEARP